MIIIKGSATRRKIHRQQQQAARRAQSENFNFIFIALLCIKYLQLFAMSHENEPFQRRRKGSGVCADNSGCCGWADGRVHADKFK